MINATELRPRRVGEIIDRGIDLLPKLVLEPAILILLVLSSAMSSAAYYLQSTLQQGGELSRLILLILAYLSIIFLSIVVNQCFTALTVLKSGKLWLGDSRSFAVATETINPSTLFKLIGLNIKIALVSFLLVFLLVIPSLIYYFNRALAPVILLIEDTTISTALKKSMRLMTYHPEYSWYSSRTPMMRISGLLFVMWIINLLPGVLAGASTGALTQQITGSPPPPPNVTQAALVFLSHLFVFSAVALGTLTLVGFYFDLRSRCEGLDLQEQVLSLANGAE
jgi:hypothetical protein